MLTVYKASAGSGKTFQLVFEYLKLILENPLNYKHILAVTFTNKATNEMKSRILEQLFKLANDEPSDYLEHLQKSAEYSEQYIRQRAGEALKNILHDYNRFSVNTIDSFTQKVIKSFNRELGISPNFTVELDTEMLLSEAIDSMMSRIDKDKKLLKWLKEFSKERIEDNRSQQLDFEIKALGEELFKENFQVFFPEEGESEYTKDKLEDFNKELQTLKRNFENELKRMAKEALELIHSNDYSVQDFSYGVNGIAGFFKHFSEGQFYDSQKNYRLKGSRVQKGLENSSSWYKKTHKYASALNALVENMLLPKLAEINSFSEKEYKQYNTTKAVLSQLRMLGILTDLKEEIKRLAHEKGVLMLSDSNLLLSKIIGNTDSPFVYEKIGNFYKHFMLDEFQDTSGLQWHNLRPLLDNSLSEGNSNLIVGDVKQSIYRWRNSDWNILANQLKEDFSPEQQKEVPLKYNWRSDKNIIDFNNAIIKGLKENFSQHLFVGFEDKTTYVEKLNKIYESFEQSPGKSESERAGLVEISFLPADEFKEESTAKLIEQVKQIQDKGIKANEIAILIRRNKEGSDIIEAFLAAAKLEENKAYNLSVLSNESLFLHASKAVLFVMSVIEILIDPDNKITQATLLQLWQSWLKPELKKRGVAIHSSKGQNMFDFVESENWQLEQNFKETFKEELEQRLAQAKKKILLSSLDEVITLISAQFHLFELETELPFLQTLTDKAGELKGTLSNDLSNFLFWWNEKGISTSVSVNEEVDSIRLITIHKSKGLEYKAVLIPYLDWKTGGGGNKSDILWCRAENAPFNRFPLLPIKMSNQLGETEFKERFFEEKTNAYIDVLNLVYVAFTRARSILMLNCPEPNIGSKSADKSIPYILNKTLHSLQSEKFDNCWNEEETTFTFGNVSEVAVSIAPPSSTLLHKYHFNDFSKKLNLRLNSEDFIIEDEKNYSVKNEGKITHDILSEIETFDDIEKACKKAVLDGKISNDEMPDIQTAIQAYLSLPEVKPWFDGSYEVLNEREILSSKKLLRPDRIMFSGDKAVIVDYKTGDKSEKHKQQIEEYAKLLKQNEFKNVECYLWYLHLNEVVEVGISNSNI